MPYRPQNKAKFKITLLVIIYFSRVLKFISLFRNRENSLLVIKIDAIGDYIVFRNYLQALRNSPHFKNFKIDLLGNKQWKQLAEAYDKEFIDNFFFIDEEQFYEAPLDLLRLALKIFEGKYTVVIQSTYSRSLMGNALSSFAAADENIAFLSDNEHDPKYKPYTDRFYTKLIKLPSDKIHESQRNHFFFQNILKNENLTFLTPTLPVLSNERKGILIFPGSSNPHRNWEDEKFSGLIHQILLNTSENIILAGGPNEILITERILKNTQVNDRVVNTAGAVTLVELVELIAKSKLVISNETSAVHIAAATRTPVICIQGGGHFDRFTPYPNQADFKPICVYETMPCYNCNWECPFMNEESHTYPCISAVSVNQVWLMLKKFENVLTNSRQHE